MKNLKTKKINKCRLCGSKNLKNIYSFGNFYVSNFVKKNKIRNSIKAPLELVHCKVCDLLQLKHSAPQELLYKGFYWYRSGVTDTMKKALKEIFSVGKKYAKLKKGDYVLDIGANDGTLLKFFKQDKIKTIGCEPAKNLRNQLKKNTDILMSDFWSYENFKKILQKNKINKPKLITAIGMFYDLEDPSKFIKDINLALDENGVFIAQLMCLKSMIKKNDLGNICHEHLEYYSYKSLIYLFENNGFQIIKVEENDVNSGSYRIYCKKKTTSSIKYKEKVNLSETKKFINRIVETKKLCVNFIKKEVKKGKVVMVYGASTKGNTILQYFDLNHKLIKYAAERTPQKWGKFTVGTGIEIISENKARKLNPDYFLVLPVAFIKEFIKRESNWLKNGGKFIVPFPKFKIISKKI